MAVAGWVGGWRRPPAAPLRCARPAHTTYRDVTFISEQFVTWRPCWLVAVFAWTGSFCYGLFMDGPSYYQTFGRTTRFNYAAYRRITTCTKQTRLY